MRSIAKAITLALLFSAPSWGDCSTYNFTTFHNKDTADADQVMANFNYILNCPNFTGNVGIGTASPARRFDIYQSTNGNVFGRIVNDSGGAAAFTGWQAQNSLTGGSTASFGMLGSGYTTNGVLVANRGLIDLGGTTAGAAIGLSGNGPLVFYTNGYSNERMRIDSSGNVGIGTTIPGSRLDVNGTITMGGAAVLTSDRRLKTDIKPIASGALTRVIALSPVTFRWKTPKDDGMRGIQMGLIAQDVERILPTAVLTAHGAFKIKSIKYNELTALLIKAVQEQQRQITTQIDQATAQQRQISMQQKQIAAMRAGNAELRLRIGMLEAQRIARAQ